MRQSAILFVFLLVACKDQRDQRLLEKEENIKNFYASQLKKQVPENDIIVILQNQQCVACRRDIFSSLYKLLAKSDLQKTFIMAVRDTVLLSLIRNLPNSSIEFDTTHKLESYGLDYGADLCLLMKDGRVNKWFELSNVNLENMHSIE